MKNLSGNMVAKRFHHKSKSSSFVKFLTRYFLAKAFFYFLMFLINIIFEKKDHFMEFRKALKAFV